MLKVVWSGDESMVLELGALTVEESSIAEVVPEELQSLLSQFGAVFQMPSGLPPQHARDHAIVLKDGTSPISVRHYQ